MVEKREKHHEDDKVHLLAQDPFETTLEIGCEKAAGKPRRQCGVRRSRKSSCKPDAGEEIRKQPCDHGRQRRNVPYLVGADSISARNTAKLALPPRRGGFQKSWADAAPRPTGPSQRKLRCV